MELLGSFWAEHWVFAILLLGETDHLAARLSGIAVIAVGTYLMIERRPEAGREGPGHARPGAWLAYAVASAVFAALTSILGKVGIAGVESNLRHFDGCTLLQSNATAN